jgi:GNAT superfamily N-acetyltransferase
MSANTVQIRRVEIPADFKAFVEFPWQIYKDDPNWTPPLLSMRYDVLDKKKNPAWEYLEGDYFTAWRGDEMVGTVAAFINHRHNEFHKEHVGWFGAFETINDPEVATTLLNTAIEWVKAKGYDAIRGPQTFTTHEEVGLLVDGFAPPVLLMTYQLPYYEALIESQPGFIKSMDQYSYYYNWPMVRENKVQDRLDRIATRIMQRGKINIRKLDRKNLRSEFELFKDLYNRAWVANWGFVPMTEKELDALIKGLGLIFDPDLAAFAEIDGKPVGFIIVVPDLNQVLHNVRPRPGVPEIWSLLQTVWHWKVRKVIDRCRVPLMGVVPEHRNKGVDLAMCHHALAEVEKKGYQEVDCGWILESNQDMRGFLETLNMDRYRTYRLYEKSFAQPES